MNNCSQLILEFELGLLTKKDKQEMFETLMHTNDDIPDEVPSAPYNLYETNLNAVSSLSMIEQCKRMNAFLDKTIPTLRVVPENSEIEQIVEAVQVSKDNQPNYYLVKIKGNSCLFKIERDVLLRDEQGSKKIIDYYESLIRSQ